MSGLTSGLKNEKCPDCKKFYEEYGWRGELHCPICGQTPEQASQKDTRPAKKEPRQKRAVISQVAIWDGIEEDPIFGFALRFARQLRADYGMDISQLMLTFRNSVSSCMVTKKAGPDGRYAIRFGYASLRCAYLDGFMEYETWQYLWPQDVTGLQGVWAVVIHEFAHVMQDNEEGYTRGQSHKSRAWQQAVLDLQELYPYDSEVERQEVS